MEPPYVPTECSAEGLPQNVQRRLQSNLRKVCAIPCELWVGYETSRGQFADLIVYGFPKTVLRTPEDDFTDSIICRIRKIVLRTPEDDFTDSIIYRLRKIVLRTPKDNFASARKTILQIAKKKK